VCNAAITKPNRHTFSAPLELLVQIYTVSTLKGATKLMAVTSSNLNRFSKLFYHWKEKEISSKTYVLFLHHTLSVLPHYLWEFKSSNLL